MKLRDLKPRGGGSRVELTLEDAKGRRTRHGYSFLPNKEKPEDAYTCDVKPKEAAEKLMADHPNRFVRADIKPDAPPAKPKTRKSGKDES